MCTRSTTDGAHGFQLFEGTLTGVRRWLGLVAMIGLVALLGLPASAQIKVACIGDSITAGNGLPPAQTYPTVLGQLLGANYEVRNYGVSGATMLRHGDLPYWNQSAFTTSSAYAPDIVVIMLGTNDSKPQNWQYSAQFEGDYLDMVAHYASLPSSPFVYVVRPCPAYGIVYNINPDIIQNAIVPLVDRVGAETGWPVIDVFTVLSNHPELFPDQIHPNADGAQRIAETVSQALHERTVRGRITLESCVNPAQPITFTFRPTDGSASFTLTQTLATDGSFHLGHIPSRTYHLAIKGTKWLRRTVPLDTTNGSVSGVMETLLAGDVTNHNAVTTADYLALKAAFGSRPGAANWNAGADLNCDEAVTTADYLLLKEHFGLTGDP